MIDRTIEACPECDSSNLSKRSRYTDMEHRYLCVNCGNEFDTPEERPPKQTGPKPGPGWLNDE